MNKKKGGRESVFLRIGVIGGNKVMQTYHIYVLKSLKDHFHYIGHTQNLFFRLTTYNAGKVRFTKGHLPFKLIDTETFVSRSDAAKREYYMKKIKAIFSSDNI